MEVFKKNERHDEIQFIIKIDGFEFHPCQMLMYFL